MRQVIAQDDVRAEEIIIHGVAQGCDVYVACATYKTQQGVWDAKKNKWVVRTPENIQAIQDIWMDVDLGPKGYTTLSELWLAVRNFCSTLGLPLPLGLGTGGGAHFHWRLREPVTYAQWHPVATLLKQLCAELDFRADPSRTADGASILRPPNTKNFKYNPPVDVVMGDVTDPIGLDDFHQRLGANSDARRTLDDQQRTIRRPDAPASSSGVAATTAGERSRIAGAMGAIYGFKQCSLDSVARKCRQISRFATTPHEPDEPDLYALASYGRHCQDSGEIFSYIADARRAAGRKHGTDIEWFISKGDQWYASTTGPATCAQWEANNPEGCVGCHFRGKITTPLLAPSSGTRFETSGHRSNGGTHSNPDTAAQGNGQAAGPSGAGNDTNWQYYRINGQTVALPVLPEPYEFRDDGAVTLVREDRNGVLQRDVICSTPFYLEAVHKAELGKQRSLNFRLWHPHTGWDSIVIDQGDLHSPAGLIKLSNQGANIHDPKLFKAVTQQMIDIHRNNTKDSTSFDQFGWKYNDRAFLFGPNLYTAGSVVPAIGSREVTDRVAMGVGCAPRGNLRDWRDAAQKLFGVDAIGHTVLFLAGIAAPFMHVLKIKEGGGIVHGANWRTGVGKSMALYAGASVWGQWDAMRMKKIDSDLSQAMTLGVMGNLPVFYDEIQHEDPKRVLNFVEMFTGGEDRKRVSQSGTHIMHSIATWRTILVMADNRSLINLLQAAKQNNAMIARVLEIEIKKIEMKATEGRRLTDQLFANAGYAGDFILRKLMEPEIYEAAVHHVNAYSDEMWRMQGEDPGQRFRMYMAGSIIAVAKFTSDWGLLDFDPQRVSDFLQKTLISNLAQVIPEETPHELLSRYLEENVNSTLVIAQKYYKGYNVHVLREPRLSLAIRYERAGDEIMFKMADFNNWLTQRGASSKDVVELLLIQGVLKAKNKFITLGAGTNYPSGDSRCYIADAKALLGVTSSLMQGAQDSSSLAQRVGAKDPA